MKLGCATLVSRHSAGIYTGANEAIRRLVFLMFCNICQSPSYSALLQEQAGMAHPGRLFMAMYQDRIVVLVMKTNCGGQRQDL